MIMVPIKYEKSIYNVSIIDGLHIKSIEFVLFLKRWRRRAKHVFPDNIWMYAIITIGWIVFGIVIFYFGSWYKNPTLCPEDKYSMIDVIWEIKSSFFTSVILAIVINAYNKAEKYKSCIQKQHNFYVDVMESFELLFKPLLGDEINRFYIFYNDNCLIDTMDYIDNNVNGFVEGYDEMEFVDSIEVSLEYIQKIKEKVRNKEIIGAHETILENSLESLKTELKIMKRSSYCFEKTKDKLVKISGIILLVVADLRRPWRWDIGNKERALAILNKYDANKIEDDFYYSMTLFGHKFN